MGAQLDLPAALTLKSKLSSIAAPHHVMQAIREVHDVSAALARAEAAGAKSGSQVRALSSLDSATNECILTPQSSPSSKICLSGSLVKPP